MAGWHFNYIEEFGNVLFPQTFIMLDDVGDLQTPITISTPM
jgi:hypothetical protein